MGFDSDENLMARYADGDYAAFQTLYQRYSGRVYHFLLKRATNPESAEELFQKVFMKLHETRGKYQSRFPFAPWVFLIARQTLIDGVRKNRAQQKKIEALGREQAIVETGEPPELSPEVVSLLKPSEQEMLQLRYFDGLEFEEISKRLGVSEVATRKRLSRALQSLKKLVRLA